MGRENGSLLLSIVHVLDTANALGYYLIWSSQLPKEVDTSILPIHKGGRWGSEKLEVYNITQQNPKGS